MQRVLDIEIFKSHLQKIFLTVFLLRLYALDNFWVISPVGVLLISANYAAKNRRAQRWNRLQSRFQYSQNRRAWTESTANGIFSILRFNMRKEQIARFSLPRNPRGKHSQRNKSAPSGSAKQHIQYNPSGSAQSAQSQRQCAVGAVRAENFALRTFRAIFFERQCVWRGRQCAPINKKPFQETTRARAPPENNCPFF